MLGISYVTTIYFLLGLAIAKGFDALFGEFNPENYNKKDADKVSLFWVGADLVLHIILLAIVFYVMRNIVERIPFPLEGVGGYQHRRLKEIGGGPVMEFVSILFQRNLKEKGRYFADRVFSRTHRA